MFSIMPDLAGTIIGCIEARDVVEYLVMGIVVLLDRLANEDEFAGARFSPDGETLFVNLPIGPPHRRRGGWGWSVRS